MGAYYQRRWIDRPVISRRGEPPAAFSLSEARKIFLYLPSAPLPVLTMHPPENANIHGRPVVIPSIPMEFSAHTADKKIPFKEKSALKTP